MKKRDIIIDKGISGAYYADKFLPDNLPGYPGYHISKLGKVYSRWDINGKGVLRVRWHLKRPQPNRLGRLLVGITNGKKTKKFQVHRLVAYQNYLREGFHIEISLIFLTEKLLLLQLRSGIFCILKNMDYDKK